MKATINTEDNHMSKEPSPEQRMEVAGAAWSVVGQLTGKYPDNTKEIIDIVRVELDKMEAAFAENAGDPRG